MEKHERKRILSIFAGIVFFNFMTIFFCIKSGLAKNDIMMRFNEHQTVTFLSALTLGLTSAVSFFIYKLKKKLSSPNSSPKFWLFSSIGFFYLCMDEFFMAHEGLDEFLFSFFGKPERESLGLDGIVIGVFALAAFAFCYFYRKEVFSHKIILPFFSLAGVCLVATVIFDQLETINIILEVLEESFKIVGVTLFFGGYLATFLSLWDKTSISLKET